MNLYDPPKGKYTRWYSFENPEGKKGCGAMKNHGHKGAPAYQLPAGEKVVLVQCEGKGILQHIWLTYDRFKLRERIRKLRLEIYWDDAEVPAVNVPLEDFFCQAAWPDQKAFENALFSSPEGRSFNCFIPMPFQKGAKVVLVNDSQDQEIRVYYCIEVTFDEGLPEDSLYFHCVYQSERKTSLGQDYEILPKISGSGRFLGTNIMVRSDALHYPTWFGEGEVKVYLDGDEEFPTLVGSGTEDYILTAWGQGVFCNMYSGCTLMQDSEKNGLVTAFYRLHVPDPVYFSQECKVTIQQIGGGGYEQIKKIIENGGKAKAISGRGPGKEYNEDMMDMNDPSNADMYWINFLREDYLSSVAYIYLDRPVM